MNWDLVIKNGNLVIPKTGIKLADIAIKNGIIQAIYQPGLSLGSSDKTIDVRGKYVFPGVIDPHSHVGYTKANYVEWMSTETPGFAIGGVTTFITYYRQYGRPPIPIEDEEFNDFLVRKLQSNSAIDFSFHFMIATKEQEEYARYINEYGINSFKFSMAYKGEEGKALGITNAIDDGFLYTSFRKLALFPSAIACVHCENVEIAYPLTQGLISDGRNDLAAYSEARPDFCEVESMRKIFFLSEITGCRSYIVHMSEKKGLLEAREHKAKAHTKCFVETCPPFLTHTKDSRLGVLAKVNPPLRTQEDIDALWEGLQDGTIDTVGSDHCDISAGQKKNDIWKGVPGVAGSGMILPILLSEGVNKGRLSLERVAEVSSYNSAKIFGLYPQKGSIEVGSDADLVIVDMELEKTVTSSTVPSAAGYSIWDGMSLKGWPTVTVSRGEIIAENGIYTGNLGSGRFVRR
jgi:dihydropyrimidinase